jgi:hypothetical protein
VVLAEMVAEVGVVGPRSVVTLNGNAGLLAGLGRGSSGNQPAERNACPLPKNLFAR